MTLTPLTASELLAILAVLIVRLGKDHPLTRRVQALQAHAQPETAPQLQSDTNRKDHP